MKKRRSYGKWLAGRLGLGEDSYAFVKWDREERAGRD